jgi:hypothetical protein
MFKLLDFLWLCLAAAAVFWIAARILAWWRQPKMGGKTGPAMYSSLRNQALTGSRAVFALAAPPPDAPAWGVLMETGCAVGTATLVSLADGSASLYFSGGGGVIGGGGHESVRAAALTFVQLAGRDLPSLAPAEQFPLPGTGRTVFYVLTDSGAFTGEASAKDISTPDRT